MNMIEKVAKVLEPQAWAALGTGDTLAYKNRRTSSLRKARLALEAMRKPDDPMRKAWLACSPGQSHWHPMISAALNEEEEGVK